MESTQTPNEMQTSHIKIVADQRRTVVSRMVLQDVEEGSDTEREAEALV